MSKKKDLNTKQRKEDKFTSAQIITALELTAGIISAAAKKLACCPNTVRSYIKRYSVVAEAKRRIEEDRLDLAEATLIKHMQEEGLTRNQLEAAKFYLMWRGQSRGYGRRKVITGKDGGAVQTEQRIDLSVLTPAERERAQLDKLIAMQVPPRVN